MQKNLNQYQSTPSLQKNQQNFVSENQGYTHQYMKSQQDYSQNMQRQPANPNKYQSNQVSQYIQNNNNNNFAPTLTNQRTISGGQNTNYFQQQNQQVQQIDQDDYEYTYQGQNQQLNHTFSEDSNVENSQVQYPSENKENSLTNQRSNKQNSQQFEVERGSQRSQNGQDQNNQEKITKKKRTLAIITLDVGGGNSDVIQVMEGDDLNVLAKNFCLKHNLDDECIQYIIKNIQVQLEKRKQRKKEKPAVELNTNQELQNNNAQIQQQKPQTKIQQMNASKDNNSNFRKSSESPKFPGLMQSQQGSIQNNLNPQGLKQSGGFNMKHYNNQAIIDEQNQKKKRPQQPSFGQNQFFESNSPQKQKMVYDQINEEDYEDQSAVGQSGNASMPDENYEYLATNKQKVKQQSKSSNGQGYEQIPAKNAFLSPPQNNKMSAQQFSSPQSAAGTAQQFYNSNSTTNAIQSSRSGNSTFPNSNSQTGAKKSINNNNSSLNSNIYNYQEDQEEFANELEDENLRNQRELAKELLEDAGYEEMNQNSNKQGFQNNYNMMNNQYAQQQQQLQQSSQQQQIQFSGRQQTLSKSGQVPKQQMGNQLYPSQKPPQFSQLQDQQQMGGNYNNQEEFFNQVNHGYENNYDFQDQQNFNQETEQDQVQESRKKIIEQISQKLNIESRKSQQVPTNQIEKSRQGSSQLNTSNQKSSKKGSNRIQQQLEAKKEQFFNSYFSQRNVPNQSSQQNLKDQDEQDDLDNYFAKDDQNKSSGVFQDTSKSRQQTLNKETSFDSPQRHIKKSYSNNNLQQYAAEHDQAQDEEKSGAQQSYEQWQKLINQRLLNGQKVNLKVKRVSGNQNTPATSVNPVQGKVFQIQNNQPSTPSNQKKSQVFSNNQKIGSNNSISPRNLSKNKSATQLNNNPLSTSSTNINKMQQEVLSQNQVNPYEKLYIQGLQQMERRQRMFEDNLEKSKEKEIVGSTFHPSISPQSRNMKLQDGVKLEDYLILEGRKNKERKAIAALIKEEESNQECKFKPQVSVVSQKLAEHQLSQYDSNYTSIHERLYQQGLDDISSKEEWSNQQFYRIYPFNPDLGVNKDRKIPEKNQKEFVNRLINEKQEKEAKILVQRQKENEFVDKQTGQKLFHPKINKDDVYQKVSQRVDLQDQLLEEELKSRSVSPMNSKKGREVNPPRIAQLKWNELLRSNRQPEYYEPKKIGDNKGRSVTPRNMKTLNTDFEETSYIPLSSRAMGASQNMTANQEIENILNQSSLRNKRITIKSSKSKEKIQTIPTINLNKKNITPNSSNYYHASNVNQTKLHKNPSQILNNQTGLNQTNFSQTGRSKSQINLNPNQTQLQLSAISQFDNNRVFNDHKLSEKIAKLFEEFDSDGDGKINQVNIDISTTDPEILEIIQNVLFEIDEKNLTLNKSQFTQLLCSHNLIIPLKRYYAEKEDEICDEDMTDYDIIRSNISAINFQNNSYMDHSQFNNQNFSSNLLGVSKQQQNKKQSQQQQQYEDYYEQQQQQQLVQNQYQINIKNASIHSQNNNNNNSNNNNSQIIYQNSVNANNVNNLYPNSITNNIINSLNQSNNRNNVNLSKKSSKNN
ncbi:hypothetical protein TTHERM_00588890 (macronuclear) [Tetrahymena thermophila SB210]|uniref:EF-hand domain-containing protein n=1 Tax=Tetrahymena thermophila (strain SB210) TaxID=312017 RepID=I7M8T8_TETTS|nr:hypothetical protein TTHERM_00588890 [Tetrahymena thermophila SB210]EAR99651.2 hypothetical protein TTHERM_00588890 [Tetrahymena thermophila SB210]|eukprot:XP_001019896.2 hypothetical protein TTHERM_00588890 [Tetrahymena thermophila SB210]